MTDFNVSLPEIKTYFDKDLLSIKFTLGDCLEKLDEIYKNIKAEAEKFRKHPSEYIRWKKLEKQYLELYERTKAKKEKQEGKAKNRTQRPFYYITMPNRRGERLLFGLRFARKKAS